MRMGSELRFAVRAVARRPVFSGLVVGVLGLGIGATTAMFGVVYGVLLRPLPFERPGELVIGLGAFPLNDSASVSPPDYLDYREASDGVFSSLGAFSRFTPRFNLATPEGPVRVQGSLVSADLFGALGVEPALGRGFSAEEERAGGERVVMLSEGAWRRWFGGETEVVGRGVTLDGAAATVVGVMPPGFDFPPGTEAWVPLRFGEEATSVRRFHYLLALGRLAPGVDRERAQAAMDVVARRLEAEYPDSNTGWRLRLEPLHERLVAAARPMVWILFAAVALVLAVACANVAGLLLARGADRGGEMAVRTALGASPAALGRQLVVESVVLALAGGAVGALLAAWLQGALAGLVPVGLPHSALRFDSAVFAFALAAALVTGVVFGLAPALQAARLGPAGAAGAGSGRTLVTRGGGRLRGALVIGQVAVTLTLLIGAGLLVRSLWGLAETETGLEPEGVLLAEVALPPLGYEESADRAAFFARLLDRARELPGVEAAGAIDLAPMSGLPNDTAVHRSDRPPPEPEQRTQPQLRFVTAGYFAAAGVPVVAGRAFDARDRPGTPPAAVIDRGLAELLFEGQSPLGRRLVVDLGEAVTAEVVGVAGEVRDFGPGTEPPPTLYLLHHQDPSPALNLLLRTEGDPLALAEPLRRAVAALDPAVPVTGLGSLDQQVANAVVRPRFRARLLAVVALGALVLSLLGLYGLLAHQVAGRTRELGLRLALGARRSEVLRPVLGRGMALVGTGLVLGLAAALAGGRVLAGLLYGVEPTDPPTLAVVTLALAAAALAACLGPAARAARTDPATALRHE